MLNTVGAGARRVASSSGTSRASHRTRPRRIGISHASSTPSPGQYATDRGTQTRSPNGSEDEASFFIRNLRALPWQRVAVWLVVAATALQLADFFGIFMGTFILTFVGRSLTVWAQQVSHIKTLIHSPSMRRKVLVIAYFITIALVLAVFGVLTIPYIVREGADFIGRLQAENIWVVVLEKMRMGIGDEMLGNIERFLLLVCEDDVLSAVPSNVANVQDMPWTAERLTRLGSAIYTMIQGYTDKAILVTSGLVTWVTHFTLQVGISLILTFMLLWDWPNISRGMTSMRNSRLAGIYSEVAPSTKVFAQLFGKALQAQFRIAIVNTLLTASGMYLLGIPGLLLLSLFVFMCSFIPVAGCIISTFPIGFVALTEYGFMKLALSILMVFGVHIVEAYGLNPAIYSAHLRLHPLLVLTVLVVAEHSMGVWGLLLAVPITVFMLDYCIRYPDDTMHAVATKELEIVQGYGEAGEEGVPMYMPSPGFTPDDSYMSPEAQAILRQPDGSQTPVDLQRQPSSGDAGAPPGAKRAPDA